MNIYINISKIIENAFKKDKLLKKIMILKKTSFDVYRRFLKSFEVFGRLKTSFDVL